jgi:hypothetical protein
MIPDTTEISKDGNRIVWENNDFNISLDNAHDIGEKILDIVDNANISGVLVDNRGADGTWPPEVNEYWPDLMAEMYENDITCATVSPSVTNSMQINRLAEDAGVDDKIKAFKEANYDEALAFLNNN